MSHKKGFTLVEIVIVVAILGLIAAIGIGALPGFKRTTDLNAASEDAVSLLAEAHARTLSSEDESQHGVYFQHDRAVLFAGTTYATSSPGNREIIFSSAVELSTISLNGGGTVVLYERLTGDTDQYGTLTFRLIRDTAKRRRVTILESGGALAGAPPSIPSADLVGYWRMDDGSGTTARDASGNGNDGTLVDMEPATDWTDGIIAGALLFDGSDEYVTVPVSGNLDMTDDLSVSVWVSPSVDSSTLSGGWNFFIYERSLLKFEIGYYNDGGPRFKPYNESGTSFDFSAGQTFAAGVWHNVIALRRGADLELYIDGALADSRSDFATTLRSGSTEIRIGRDFPGTIDEVALWTRALTDDEIDQIYSMRN